GAAAAARPETPHRSRRRRRSSSTASRTAGQRSRAGRRAGSAFSRATRWYSASSSARHAAHPATCCRAHADPSPAASAKTSSIVQCIIVRLLHRAAAATGRGRAPAATWKNSPSCPSAPRSPRACSPRHRGAIPPHARSRSTARVPVRDRSAQARRWGSCPPPIPSPPPPPRPPPPPSPPPPPPPPPGHPPCPAPRPRGLASPHRPGRACRPRPHPRPRPHRRLLVELLRLAHPVMADSHQGFGCGDLPDPAPQVSFPAVLLDAPDHFEERLLQHILGVLGAAQDAEREIVHGRLE